MKDCKAAGRYQQIMRILVFLGLLMFLGAAPVRVKAASGYKELFHGTGGTEAAKSGQYYFKVVNYTQVYVAKGKNGSYRAAAIPSYGSFANGKNVFYVRNNALYKYILSSGKEQKLTTLEAGEEESYSIALVRGKKIYLNMGSFPKWRYVLYSYHVGTGKLKKEKDDCCILCSYGDYVMAQKEYRTDVSPFELTIYKLGSSGLKKVKTLTSRGHMPVLIGSKFYYVSYSGSYMKEATVYSCDIKGNNRKTLGSFEAKGDYSSVLVTQITAKKCRVNIDGVNYEYTYKTKKKKRI